MFLPSPLPCNLSDYAVARSNLINSERSLRQDYALLKNATEEELQAENIVRDIRKEENERVWSEEHLGAPNVFPGMAFLSAKNIIEKTKIFKILTKMPKGALLHAHLDAMVNASYLLQLALKQPNVYIRIQSKLTASTLSSVLPEFRGLSPSASETCTATSISGPNGKIGEWVNIHRARHNFSIALGGPEGFDAWVLGSLMINPAEAYGTHNTVDKIWNKFLSTFRVGNGLTRYEPIWADYIREFFYSSIEDGISYIETRVNFFFKFMIGADGEETVTHNEMVRTFQRVAEEVKEDMKRKGREGEFIGARIIYSTVRVLSCDELEWYLDDCIQLKKEFPETIAGFDLVGDENKFHPLSYYIEPLLRFRQRVTDLGLDIPFILHAGETLGDGDEADCNVYDAVLLGTKRIGHGFSIVKHPKVMQICKEKGITLEVCPISNEILRFTSSMPTHPLPIVLNNGISVALCSDDPAVFGSMGLSYDFFQVLVASEITGLMTLKGLARKSIEVSTLGDDDKNRALSAWEERWKAFVRSIIDGSVLKS